MTGLSPIGSAATAAVDVPDTVRRGDAKAKQAWSTAVAFEQVLAGQLAQELQSTVAAGDGSDGASGLLGGGAQAAPLSDVVTQALTGPLTAGGGLGIATGIARALDPALKL